MKMTKEKAPAGMISTDEYVARYNVTKKMIYNYMNSGVLNSKLVNRRRFVEDRDFRDIVSTSHARPRDGEPATGDKAKATASKQEILMDAKIKKLNADTDYQLQRLEDKKDQMLSEYTDLIIEAYTEAFSGVKNDLIAMRLDKERLGAFIKVFESANSNFIAKLKKMRKEL